MCGIGYAQSQEIEVAGRLFCNRNGKWYSYGGGRILDEINPSKLVVRMVGDGDVAQFLSQSDRQTFSTRPLPLGRTTLIESESGIALFSLANSLHMAGIFDIIEFDSFGSRNALPDDQLFPSQWGLHNPGPGDWPHGYLGADIQAEAAWAITKGSPSIILAVIDSGLDLSHPDLVKNLWVNHGEIPGNNIDDDGNGYVDDIHGYCFFACGTSTAPNGVNHHGTTVAGVIMANSNNSIGVAGVAGGWNESPGCSILVLKEGDERPNRLAVVEAMAYACRNGARVINISSVFLDSPFPWYPATFLQAAVDEAVENYGIMIVGSAGNDNTYPIGAPAAYGNTLCVGGSTWFDTYDPSWVHGDQMDVIAPSGGIYTTDMWGTYNSFSGNSLATPFVTGVCGLMLSINPGLSFEQILLGIRETAEKVQEMGGSNWTPQHGYGRLDAHQALLWAQTTRKPQITHPNGGELSSPGQPIQITWNRLLQSSGHPSYVAIDLHDENGLVTSISQSTLNDGLHSWTIPFSVISGGKYRVRVHSLEPQSDYYSDFGDKPFQVLPSIQLTWPLGGEQLRKGHLYSIDWNSNCSEGVLVELLPELEILCPPLYDNQLDISTTNSYAWRIDDCQPAGNFYRVRLTSQCDPTVRVTSGFFTILP